MSDTAEPLPAWIYENKQGVIIGVTTLLSVLAIVAVILRFKCRFLAQASIALDDWLILLALPFSIAEAICVAYATKDGLGRHVKIISKPALLEGGKLFFTMQIVWAISTSLVKFSILVFYLRVFSVLNYIRFSAWFLIITVACWMVSNAIARGFQCTPISKVWDDSLPGHCLDTVALFVIGSVSDVVLDFLILVLPLPAIVRLQMPLSKKILVAIIFALGGLTCVLSLIRYLETENSIYNREDVTWTTRFSLVLSAAEPCLGILCACLPALQPLMQGLKEGALKLSSMATALIPKSNKGSNASQEPWKARLSYREQRIEIPDWSEVNLQETSRNRHWAGDV